MITTERGAYQAAVQAGDHDVAVMWAGEVVDLISSVEPAGTLVRRIGAGAEQQLTAGMHRSFAASNGQWVERRSHT